MYASGSFQRLATWTRPQKQIATEKPLESCMMFGNGHYLVIEK